MATRVYNDNTGEVYYANNQPVVYRSNPVYRLLYYLLDVLEIILAVRFVLRMLGASQASGFVRFMYNITHPFVAPFNGIVAPTVARGSGLVIEWSTLIAMVIYALAVYAVIELLKILFRSY